MKYEFNNDRNKFMETSSSITVNCNRYFILKMRQVVSKRKQKIMNEVGEFLSLLDRIQIKNLQFTVYYIYHLPRQQRLYGKILGQYFHWNNVPFFFSKNVPTLGQKIVPILTHEYILTHARDIIFFQGWDLNFSEELDSHFLEHIIIPEIS